MALGSPPRDARHWRKKEMDKDSLIKVAWWDDDHDMVRIDYDYDPAWFVIYRDQAKELRDGLTALLEANNAE
jgi:hypothetical protein